MKRVEFIRRGDEIIKIIFNNDTVHIVQENLLAPLGDVYLTQSDVLTIATYLAEYKESQKIK
ncbi:hypothetical protein [Paenibacillus cremeus]|uniref:Uncharacterized protein n=1 Tax=Paenibacillus cremeus TaxID=2163881 RepID=A0A559K542_9BACL|nr:hypothetical protein [Paenibacillus cremeus]TVY07226.1 hypothetical protein FPZ49_25310 [Paenibacillus cremeus]